MIIHGKGGHGKVVLDAAYAAGWVGVTVTDDSEGTRPLATDRFITAIGDSAVRRAVRGTVNVIHPTAYIAESAKIGLGVYVGAFAVVNPDSVVGDGAIINTHAVVEHDCTVGAFAHIAPGAVLCGGVTIGDNVLIGANSVVKQGLAVSGGVTVGCGAVVVEDIPAGETWAGNPARLL